MRACHKHLLIVKNITSRDFDNMHVGTRMCGKSTSTRSDSEITLFTEIL